MKVIYEEGSGSYDDAPDSVHVAVLKHEQDDAWCVPSYMIYLATFSGTEYRINRFGGGGDAKVIREAIAWYDAEAEAAKAKMLLEQVA